MDGLVKMRIDNAIDLVYPLVDGTVYPRFDGGFALLDFAVDGGCRLFGFVDAGQKLSLLFDCQRCFLCACDACGIRTAHRSIARCAIRPINDATT